MGTLIFSLQERLKFIEYTTNYAFWTSSQYRSMLMPIYLFIIYHNNVATKSVTSLHYNKQEEGTTLRPIIKIVFCGNRVAEII